VRGVARGLIGEALGWEVTHGSGTGTCDSVAWMHLDRARGAGAHGRLARSVVGPLGLVHHPW
jgi:hypothetical protein